MISQAKDGMRSDLERLWRGCFGDTDSYVKYFFDYRYNPNNCLVYVDEEVGRPVAMLHMLNANITEDSELSRAMYIYAACTRADYRRKGIMQSLVDFSKKCAKINGQKYIMLVPQTRELFKYYEKEGFHRCFKVREVNMERRDLITLSKFKGEAEKSSAYRFRENALSISDIHAIRRDILVDREGFITWDFSAFKYAAGAHENIGGKIITVSEESEAGYAMCNVDEEGTVFVSEFICHNGLGRSLLRAILEAYPQEKFRFRLPVFDELFAPFGEVVDYGMICSVSGKNPVALTTLKGSRSPYLGLALD